MSATLRLLCASAAALLLAACRPDPEDLIFIIGSVTDPATAQPQAGEQVLLERDKTEFCFYGGVRETPFAPLTERGFTPLAEVETDEEGRFLVELMRFQVARTDLSPYCLRLRLPEQEGGARAEVEFSVLNFDLEPPPLFRWAPPLEPSLVDGTLVIPQPTLPAPITEPIDWSQPGSYDQGFQVRTYEWELLNADGLPVWREEASSDLRLPIEVQEDFTGLQVAVQMFAVTSIYSGSFPLLASDFFRSIHRSRQRVLEETHLVPVSRGARCWFGEQEQLPCPLTDGSLAMSTIVGPEDPSSPGLVNYLDEVRLELAEPATPRAAVVRDLFYGGGPGTAAIIEGSLDGAAWIELGRAEQGLSGASVYPVYVELGGTGWYRVISLDASLGAFNQFRLRADVDGALYGIRELSLLE